MKDELFTDEALEAALTTIQKKHLDDLSSSMEPHDFSEEFEQKMAKLQRQERRHTHLRRLTRWAVAALLAVVIGLGLFFTVSTEARADALTWLRREYSRYTSYLFKGDQDQIPRYVLTWVPEGCELYKEENTVDQTYVYYDPGDSARGFTVTVMPLSDDRGMVLDGTENAQVTMLLVRGCSAQLYTFPDHSILIWIDENAGVVFSVTGTLSTEELLQIAEGLVPVK